MIRRLLSRANLFHLILIAVIAALGIAIKPVVVPLAQLITGPFIPGGAAVGGIYMLFLVLAVSLTRVRGAGFLCGLTQALLVMALGVAGSHGAASLITYTLPGLAVDLVFLPLTWRRREPNVLFCVLACMLANITGTMAVAFALFQVELIMAMLLLCLAALSGALGGVAAWAITKQIRKILP
ncbi:MAG: ECF transporter S component [Oscillospiraceae bacterium]|nr:ECF transporter S component [Oscillospiraceae bacterium]